MSRLTRIPPVAPIRTAWVEQPDALYLSQQTRGRIGLEIKTGLHCYLSDGLISLPPARMFDLHPPSGSLPLLRATIPSSIGPSWYRTWTVHAPTGAIAATDLEHAQLPVEPNLVPGILPHHGLVILAGRPKSGKSFVALSLAMAVARRAHALECQFMYPGAKGAVLYLCLEDTAQRLLTRQSSWHPIPPDLHYAPEWSTGDAALAQLEAYLSAHPCRLAIVDVWQKLHPGRASTYARDYQSAGALKALADRFQTCILIVTHTRKLPAKNPFDTITGSVGLIGCADGAMVLDREPKAKNATLWVTGKDLRELALPLTWHHDRWIVNPLQTQLLEHHP